MCVLFAAAGQKGQSSCGSLLNARKSFQLNAHDMLSPLWWTFSAFECSWVPLRHSSWPAGCLQPGRLLDEHWVVDCNIDGCCTTYAIITMAKKSPTSSDGGLGPDAIIGHLGMCLEAEAAGGVILSTTSFDFVSLKYESQLKSIEAFME
eukprot:scaffold6813_cov97-Skeletonema_dohrnii-CCMP3373.AAC.2